MSHGAKIASIFLRVGQIICAAIVVGITGHYIHLLDEANASHVTRIVYALSIGSISLFFSLVWLYPFVISFYLFLVDFALFINWMVVFGLLVDLTGRNACDSYWYWSSWGYYWGGWWRTVPLSRANAALVGTGACAEWRSTLAFSFIGGLLWLISGCVGIYFCSQRKDEGGFRGNKASRGMDVNGQHAENGVTAKPEVSEAPPATV